MKITISQIINGIQAYRELQSLKFSPRTSLNIYKLGKELDRELQTYRDLSKDIYEKHNIPQGPNGFDVEGVESEVLEKVANELQELTEAEVDIKDIKVPFSDIERSNNEISPNLLAALDWAFDFGEKPQPVEEIVPDTETIESATVA